MQQVGSLEPQDDISQIGDVEFLQFDSAVAVIKLQQRLVPVEGRPLRKGACGPK